MGAPGGRPPGALVHGSAQLDVATVSGGSYSSSTDALVLEDGQIFPALEMNARHSFFSFVDAIQRQLAPGGAGVFRWWFFKSAGRIGFWDLLEQKMGSDLLLDPERGEGVVVPVSVTLVVPEPTTAPADRPPLRRLIVLTLATSTTRARAIADARGDRVRSSLLRPQRR